MTVMNLPSLQDSTECESGCQCPDGLLDDGKGSCVREKDCPCQHDGHIYTLGTKIPNECNVWYVVFLISCIIHNAESCICTFY